jgi:hypothetical protein
MKWTITCKSNRFTVRILTDEDGFPLPYMAVTFLTLDSALGYVKSMGGLQP